MKPQNTKRKIRANDQSGLAAITITIVVLLIAGVIATTFVFVFLNRIEAARNVGLREQAYFAAESGVEDALLRIADPDQELPSAIPYTFAIGDSSVTVDAQAGSKVIGDGTASNRTRRMVVHFSPDTEDFTFGFAAHAGNGGIEMGGNSTIQGTVHSNGDISGGDTIDQETIEDASDDTPGDVTVAGTGVIERLRSISGDAKAGTIQGEVGGRNIVVDGNATAVSLLDEVDVGGDAFATNLSNCAVTGDAKYVTAITNCTIGGSTTQVGAPPTEEDTREMPISDDTLDSWEQKAEDSGVISASDPLCDDDDGDLVGEISIGPDADDDVQTLTLGGDDNPGKVECDIEVDGGAGNPGILTQEGFVWVSGSVVAESHGVIQLSSDFGRFSSVIIIHDETDVLTGSTLSILDNAQIRGSGTSGSFLTAVSRNESAETGGPVIAIDSQDSSSSAIYYAPHGLLRMLNGSELNEATAYKVDMQNGATLIYDSELQSVQFADNEDVSYSISSWQEE